MLAFPFHANQLEHHLFLISPNPPAGEIEKLLDACAHYDRERHRVTVLSTGPWPKGRWMVKAFGPEFAELGNVYSRKGMLGRARLLYRKFRELRVAAIEWFTESPPSDWRLARRLPGWTSPPSAVTYDRAIRPYDPNVVAIVLKSDLSSHAAHISQSMQTAAALARAGATIYIAAPIEKGSFNDVLDRCGIAPATRGSLLHLPIRSLRRNADYVDYLDDTLSDLSARGCGTLYFRQVRIASMLIPQARRLGMRIFLEAHHPYATWAIYQRRKYWRDTPAAKNAFHYYRITMREDRRYERTVYEAATGILCTTEAMQRHVDRLGGAGKTLLLRNGAPPIAHHSIPASEMTTDLIYTGKTSSTKGTGVLIRSLVHLPGVHLTVVGGPRDRDVAPYRELSEQLGVADRVTFHLWENQPELFERVRRARVAVHPITGKGSKEWRIFTCPLKIMEYMALGTPVVGTNLPAIRELIESGVNGVLAAPGDAQALATSIRSVLEDDAYGRRLAEAARRSVADWTPDTRGATLWEFLRGNPRQGIEMSTRPRQDRASRRD